MGPLRWVLVSFLLLLAPVGHAFHEGGDGFCEGCHDLHGTGEREPATFLLRGADPGSTCLRCHAEAGAEHNVFSADGSSHTPGGDFYWLTKTYTWKERGQVFRSPGEAHGHNVVASEFGLGADGGLPVAPGGSYPSSDLSCVSCHDPHGQRGEGEGADGAGDGFRLLAGVGYVTAGTPFSKEAPVAVAPESWVETDRNHVDYGAGMSEWCGNCHVNIASGGGGMHPSGAGARLSGAVSANYNAYVSSGDLSGSADRAYLALVPFEHGMDSVSALDPYSTQGPAPATANVMCLTCHRAHASAFRNATRWDTTATFLADSHPHSGDTGATVADEFNSYYGRDLVSRFGPYQRSLCNKCHGKD